MTATDSNMEGSCPWLHLDEEILQDPRRRLLPGKQHQGLGYPEELVVAPDAEQRLDRFWRDALVHMKERLAAVL